LAGTLVLDMSTYVAAPSVGALLYDLGADVVKMEPPAGDGRRSALTQVAAGDPPGLNRPFHMDNRGKWSVTVALDDANGLALARRLIARADIVIGNMPPPRQRRFRLAGDDILAINPRAVCVQLTAYGTTGPDADQSGFDIQAFFARSGITGVLARQADEPPRSRSGQGDHVTTLVLLSGLFAALHARERSGRGQLVETSLLAAGAFTIGADLLLARAGLAVEPVHPLASCYRCADGRWLHVGVAEPDRGQAWDALRAGAGVDGAAALAAFVAARPLAAATAALKALSVPAAPVQALPDVVRDPQVLANDMLMAIEHPRHGTIRCVAPPYRIDGIGQRPPQPGPEIGEHTDAVLARCGLSAAEIAALRAAGTLG
jgi:crotonobetainyl-CoA:carnitine CoA-transferase CaiB-like acyl-CoA transferase